MMLDFQGLLHMPYTAPEMEEFGFALAPGTDNFVAVKPEVMQSREDISGISYKKRNCYVYREKELRFFKRYAYHNCFIECASNYTFEVSNLKFLLAPPPIIQT